MLPEEDVDSEDAGERERAGDSAVSGASLGREERKTVVRMREITPRVRVYSWFLFLAVR